MEKSMTNFMAYSDVENLKTFKTHAEIENYRNQLLLRNKDYVDFFKVQSNNVGLNVVEIGSGSSCLLYCMEQRCILREGLGIEPSLSRYKFAEKWKEDKGFSKVRNVNIEFIKIVLSRKQRISGWIIEASI